MVTPTTRPHHSPNSILVRKATEADRPVLTHLLSSAFDREPFAAWFVRQDARRAERFLGFFDVDWRLAMPQGEVYTTEERQGAALWIPPAGGWQACGMSCSTGRT